MASSGASVRSPTPEFLAPNNPFSTAGDMKFHLQNLLDSKERQLQQAGSLGQRVLAQQMELEERIRQLQELESDKGEEDEIDHEARERYHDLADTIIAWDSENAQLSSVFGSSSKVRVSVATWHHSSFLFIFFSYSAFSTVALIHPLCHLATCLVMSPSAQRLLLARRLPSLDAPKTRPTELMMSVSLTFFAITSASNQLRNSPLNSRRIRV